MNIQRWILWLKNKVINNWDLQSKLAEVLEKWMDVGFCRLYEKLMKNFSKKNMFACISYLNQSDKYCEKEIQFFLQTIFSETSHISIRNFSMGTKVMTTRKSSKWEHTPGKDINVNSNLEENILLGLAELIHKLNSWKIHEKETISYIEYLIYVDVELLHSDISFDITRSVNNVLSLISKYNIKNIPWSVRNFLLENFPYNDQNLIERVVKDWLFDRDLLEKMKKVLINLKS